jgi:glycosyltransferase involved in cell wall biosynthesis
VNILLGVHQFFPRHYAGTERYVLNLARQLLFMGHRVHVLTYDFARDGAAVAPGGKLRANEYVYQGIPVTAFSHPEFPDFTYDLINDELAEATSYLLRRQSFDIYHCAHPLRIGGSLRAAHAAGLPIVLMLTDFWLFCALGIMLRLDHHLCGGPNGGSNCIRHCFPSKTLADFEQRQRLATELAGYADRILSPSRFLIGAFHHNRFLEGRVRLSRHGFDYGLLSTDRMQPQPRDLITIGYIGTVQYHKGVHVLVDAFRKVPAPHLRLEIWGGCFHETDYLARVKQLADGDARIRFRGAYDYGDLETVLAGVDLVVVPSIWYENAPLTVTSSHAAGIPVIASDIGGMAEMVIDGVNGLTFPIGDADALAERLRRVADDPGLLAEFRRAIVPPAGLEEEAFRMERLFREVIAGRAAPHTGAYRNGSRLSPAA